MGGLRNDTIWYSRSNKRERQGSEKRFAIIAGVATMPRATARVTVTLVTNEISLSKIKMFAERDDGTQ